MAVKKNNTDNKLVTVFLGSSNKFNYSEQPNDKDAKALKRIVASLQNACKDVHIMPWWEHAIGGDEYVLEVVTDNILSSDFCIFVVAKDEETNTPKDSKDKQSDKWFVPNSNVLVEIGIAVAKGKRVLVLNWAPKDVKLPSDYQGKFYTAVKRSGRGINQNDLIRNFKKVYDEYISDRRKNTILMKYKNINIYFNEDLANELTKPVPPKNWGTKAMFIGSKSSNHWAEIEKKIDYPETSTIKDFINHANGIEWEDDSMIHNINELIIDNIVSFGPGAGTIDNDLVRYFQRGNFMPYYIPIDISIPLVTKAIDVVSKSACFPVPFAIVDDFEEGSCFVRLKELIESKEHEIHKRNLFSIVGVTFSNYSKAEHYFFKGLLSIMNPNEDYLLLDVAADNKNEEELKETVHNQINTIYKEWIEHSIRKRFPDAVKKMNAHKAKNKKSSLMDNVEVRVLTGNRRSYLTDLKCTRVLDCHFEGDTENNSLLIIKHYDYKEFKMYLQRDFDIVASSYVEEQMRGLFLLKKKTTI